MTTPEKMFHLGRLQSYSQTFRLGWKSLPGKNTLAYYENSKITDKKVLLHWAQIFFLIVGVLVLYYFVYPVSNKAVTHQPFVFVLLSPLLSFSGLMKMLQNSFSSSPTLLHLNKLECFALAIFTG